MERRAHLRILGLAGAFATLLMVPGAPIDAQIGTAIVDQQRAALERQTTDPDQKRDGGTQPRDWEYQLAEGVRTRQVTFYVDGGVPLYGKLFLPKGFTATGKYPAVVVGHGINALSIGIEKFAARFAERGLVAMAIDYQSYGFSGSGSDDVRLLEPDPTADDRAVSEHELRILLKRTNLNNAHEVNDFRAAVSFLQGEPGVDPERIGIWGSSNGGSVVAAVAAVDGRVKAVVAQVSTPRPAPRGPVPVPANFLKDGIERVRTGQGAEADGGFSFKSKIDLWSNQRNRDVRPGTTLDQILPSTAVLFVPAEKDELTQGPGGAIEAATFLSGRGVAAQAVVLPGLTHFQAYSYAGFEVGSSLAADWLLKYLQPGVVKPTRAAAVPPPAVARPPAASPAALPSGVTAKEVRFFSEAVACYAKVFYPRGFSASNQSPAVVLAPGWGDTVAATEGQAAELAGRGIVAMAIDYRGWGKSGGFIYLADNTKWDDRLRFSQHTSKVRIRRRRLLPEAQLADLRNAITYIQGEPGVDAARIGVWGTGLSGGHVLALSAIDARVKAGVAIAPTAAAEGAKREAFVPTPAQQAEMVALARKGQAPATAAAAFTMNEAESRLARAQYLPLTLADQIPKTTSLLFLVTGKDTGAMPGTTLPSGGAAADMTAAAAWFVKHL